MGPALLLPAGMAWLLACAGNATVLLAASWVGARLLRGGPAAARHQLWALGVAGALVMPLLCWALPSLPAPVDLPPWAGAPWSTLVAPSGPTLLATAVPLQGTPAAGVAPLMFGVVWAVGSVLVSLRLLRGHLAAHRLGRTAAPAVTPASVSAHHEAAAALEMAASTPVALSASVTSPMTVGILRPRVLLPLAAADWTAEGLRAVLLHELGHVRRQDTRIQLAADLVCALYWWNPLTWMAAARLRVERELACDDLVLNTGMRPSTYASTLLDVARQLTAGGRPAAGAICMVEGSRVDSSGVDLSGVDPSSTEARLRRILDGAAQRRPPGAWFRLITRGAAITLAGTLACGVAPVAAVPPPPDNRPLPAPSSPTPAIPRIGVVSLGTATSDSAPPEALRPPPAIAADTLELSTVINEVQRHLGELQQCYEQRLREQPALSGEISVHWAIAPSGDVVEQCISTDTVGDPEMLACVNTFVSGAHFPVSGEPSSVSVPFVFRAAE